MKKIYTRNNYLIIEWTGSAPLMRPKKDISFRRTNANHNQYMIADRSQPIPGDLQTVLWTDFIKEDNTPFASIVEFNNWITENTGNFKSGSEHGEFEPIEHDLAEFKNESENPFLRSDQMPPKGDKGDKGDAGVNSISIPTLRTPINKATAYQALNTSKPAIITITLTSTSSFSLTGNISN